MLELICFLMPSFVSLAYYRHINKEHNQLKLADLIMLGVFAALNNILAMVSIILLNIREETIYFDATNLSFVAGYMGLAMVFSIITPLLVKYFKQNVALDIKAEKKLSRRERRALKKEAKKKKKEEKKSRKINKKNAKKTKKAEKKALKLAKKQAKKQAKIDAKVAKLAKNIQTTPTEETDKKEE